MVEDTQYGYMFNMSQLYNGTGDYTVSSVKGAAAAGVRIVLNVCNKLVGHQVCKGGNAGACVIEGELRPVDIQTKMVLFCKTSSTVNWRKGGDLSGDQYFAVTIYLKGI